MKLNLVPDLLLDGSTSQWPNKPAPLYEMFAANLLVCELSDFPLLPDKPTGLSDADERRLKLVVIRLLAPALTSTEWDRASTFERIGYMQDAIRERDAVQVALPPAAPTVTAPIEPAAKLPDATDELAEEANFTADQLLDLKALAIFFANRTFKKKDIAKALGLKHTQSICPARCPELDKVMKANRQAHAPPRGSKSKDGTMESYEDDE